MSADKAHWQIGCFVVKEASRQMSLTDERAGSCDPAPCYTETRRINTNRRAAPASPASNPWTLTSNFNTSNYNYKSFALLPLIEDRGRITKQSPVCFIGQTHTHTHIGQTRTEKSPNGFFTNHQLKLTSEEGAAVLIMLLSNDQAV